MQVAPTRTYSGKWVLLTAGPNLGDAWPGDSLFDMNTAGRGGAVMLDVWLTVADHANGAVDTGLTSITIRCAAHWHPRPPLCTTLRKPSLWNHKLTPFPSAHRTRARAAFRFPPTPSVEIVPERLTVTVEPGSVAEATFSAANTDCPDAPCTYEWRLYCVKSFVGDATLHMEAKGVTVTATFGSDPSANVDTTGDAWRYCWVIAYVTDYSLRTVGAGAGLAVE